MKTRRRTAAPSPEETAHLATLEALLEHSFQRPELLELALTHSSWAFEASDTKGLAGSDNERLEFVGDAVLGMLAAESLFRHFPSASEGELTRMRASVVSRQHLGEVGLRLGIGQWLRLGHTAEMNGSRARPSVFSNTIEALIAALYFDGGPETARQFVEREILGPALPGMLSTLQAAAAAPRTFNGAVGDHKTALQEHLRAAGRGQPEYRLLAETGPDHRRLFQVEVRVVGEAETMPLAAAEGLSKKKAQQEAARLALAQLSRDPARGGTR